MYLNVKKWKAVLIVLKDKIVFHFTEIINQVRNLNVFIVEHIL